MGLKFSTYKLVSIILSLFFSFLTSTSYNDFFDCISYNVSSEVVFTPSDASYTTFLESIIQNLRCATLTTPKPLAIITPLSYSHVQTTVICSVKSGLQIRIRSGGHDYEGLSYTSSFHAPFIILDLNTLRSVTVDSDNKTAWVESGATIGELLYTISQESDTLGFPAGECPTVGIGGHFSGGGYGVLARKYGLAADNVIDALIVDVNGLILDRGSMGEDLFWAIRGGGGASFGVILAWKVNLVYVPPIVTVFSVGRAQGVTQLLNKWQYISHNVSENLFIKVEINTDTTYDGEKNRTLQVTFNSLFLGTSNKLISMINDIFPELGLKEKDCIEMSWIESVVRFSFSLSGETVEALNERRPWPKTYYKVKSDYVKKPIPEEAIERFLEICLLADENLSILMEPHGGMMSKIAETNTPYPHRAGNLYIIQYVGMTVETVTSIYDNMRPFVSRNPRAAYVNFRDLDLGTNGDSCAASYMQAAKWGRKYFKGNFRRLAMVKGKSDPMNFFCYEQSIPPLVLCKEKLQNGNQYAECYEDGGFHQNI